MAESGPLTRFSVSMGATLLQRFDQFNRARGYRCRSEAIRDLIRDELVEQDWQASDEEVAGSITLLYHHHVKGLGENLTALQHRHHGLVLSTMHLHLDHDHCLEVLVLKGPAARVRELADRLLSIKGVIHSRLTVTSTGGRIA